MMEETIRRVHHDNSMLVACIDDALVVCASSWCGNVGNAALQIKLNKNFIKIVKISISLPNEHDQRCHGMGRKHRNLMIRR